MLLVSVLLVSVLFAIGAFGMFAWAETGRISHEMASYDVVNTIVVMEKVYLFSVRYIHGASITWQGVLGTAAVLVGVVGIIALQLSFTYIQVMQRLFQTRSIALLDGVIIVGVGIALLVILELEKRMRLALFPVAGDQRKSVRSVAS